MQLTLALNDRENQLQNMKKQLDSMSQQKLLGKQVFKELKAQYPVVKSFILEEVTNITDTTAKNIWVSFVNSDKKIDKKEQKRISDWLKVRVNTDDLIINFKE